MQLNLRDLFWLIFVAAVATMWWIDRSKLADRLEALERPVDRPPFATVPPPLAAPSYVAPNPFSNGPDPFGAPPSAAPAPPAPTENDPFAPATTAPTPSSAPATDPFG
jgi:hypothetical protein